MPRRVPRAENGLCAECPKGLPALSVSICLRLEIIAILSGVVSLAGTVSGGQL
jgi:hypothetical protein